MDTVLHHDSELERYWGIDTSFEAGERYLGYLLTVNPTRLAVDDADKSVQTCSAFYLYFVLPSGATRRIIKLISPHILVAFKPDFVGLDVTDVDSMMCVAHCVSLSSTVFCSQVSCTICFGSSFEQTASEDLGVSFNRKKDQHERLCIFPQ